MPGAYERLRALDHLMRDGEQSGCDLREKINSDLCSATNYRIRIARCRLGWLLTMSAPSFYQMMCRLEDANEVDGWYREIIEDDVPSKQKWYRIKENGLKKLGVVDNFLG